MKIDEIIEPLTEAKKAYKRVGSKFIQQYRCTAGRKKGKLVSNPSKCSARKDPKKVKQGRKNARLNKASRVRKTAVAKKTSMSKMLKRMNQRIG